MEEGEKKGGGMGSARLHGDNLCLVRANGKDACFCDDWHRNKGTSCYPSAAAGADLV